MEAKELRLANYVLCEWIEELFNEDSQNFEEVVKQKIGKVVQLDSTGTLNYSITVETKNDDGVYVEDFESIKPIPLNEEWLVRFGFVWTDFEEENPEFLGFVYRNSILFNSDKSTEFGIVTYKCKILGDIDIKYVHQLQTLYFALTGEELTLKTE